jgi:DNA repair protein RadA/Sms
VRDGWCAVGEVALSGAVRPVTALSQRVAEAARLGFTDVVVPAGGRAVDAPAGVTLHPVEQLAEAVRAALVPRGSEQPDF